MTADDVIFSFELLRDKGRPAFSTRLKRVAKMEKVGDMSVRFTLNDQADREFPLILALSPVLPKHATKVEGFDETTLEPPVGSGPYLIKEIKPGERIVYARNPDYWAKDLPPRSASTITTRSRSSISCRKAASLKLQERRDRHLSGWRAVELGAGYDFPAVAKGDVVKAAFKPQTPANMYGFVFKHPPAGLCRPDRAPGPVDGLRFRMGQRNLYEGAYQRPRASGRIPRSPPMASRPMPLNSPFSAMPQAACRPRS